MKVCIAEKPSVAGEIAKVLGATSRRDGYYEGNGYQVTWTFGHLCQLNGPDDYRSDWKSWRLDALPMVPERYGIKLISDAGVKRQFKVIKELYKKADVIINCGDAGQEGELIQRWVMELAGVRCPVQRLWISSLTEDSIRDGFRHLQSQGAYDRLYEAGRARAEGDWLLGMNATRLYTLKYGGYNQMLSIGRVQTPTLAMIVGRDLQIEHFQPEPYWVLSTRYRGTVFTCTKGKFREESDGSQLLQSVMGKPFSVTDVQQKRGKEQPPQLYDLTTLQVDCNKKFGLSAEQTLKNIQSLYEKKLTTYPRVDTKYLTDDLYVKCPGIVANLGRQQEYVLFTSKLIPGSLYKSPRVFDNGKVTDHHAIIPTGEVPGVLSSPERKVYDLIVRRFLAVFYPDCQYATTVVLGKSSSVAFRATGKTILLDGWRFVYAKLQSEDDDEEQVKDSEENGMLPRFVIGESGVHVPSLSKKMTTPPSRFTEATLLQAMETAGQLVDDEELRELMKENGIGRPSSRAGIIETLLKRSYVRREKKKLVSTDTGRDLIGLIKSELLKSPVLTGVWEKKLRDIEHGGYTRASFMRELEGQLRDIIAEVKGDASSVRVSSLRASDGVSSSGSSRKGKSSKVGDVCPVCGKGVVRKGPYGLFCDQYKVSGCKWRG